MKIIKSLVVGLGMLSLSGCMWQTIDEVDIYYAKKLCAEKGDNLYKISEYVSGYSEVRCKGKLDWHDLESYKRKVLYRGVESDE